MFFTKVLEERKSKFNGNIRVLQTWGMGTYIQAGGLTQSGGIVENIWKNTLRKVKGKRQEVKDVLILGLGGGTVAKLVRKNWSETKIIGVDIDPIMIELGKKYLELNNYNIDIRIADASNLSNLSNLSNQKYDLIIVDLYQGDKFPKKFESENYIQLMRTVLSSKGIIVFNRLRYKSKKEEAEKFGKKLQKYFRKVDYYYPPANLMFFCSS